MSMQVAASYKIPASATRVAALLADPQFAEETAGGAESAQASVRHAPDGGFTLSLRRPVPADDLPASVRVFTGGDLELRQALVWQPAAPDGARSATMAGEIVGAPVQLEGTVQLTPTADGCELSIDGDIFAMVPLVGPTIEQAGATMVVEVLREQVEALTERLADAP